MFGRSACQSHGSQAGSWDNPDSRLLTLSCTLRPCPSRRRRQLHLLHLIQVVLRSFVSGAAKSEFWSRGRLMLVHQQESLSRVT